MKSEMSEDFRALSGDVAEKITYLPEAWRLSERSEAPIINEIFCAWCFAGMMAAACALHLGSGSLTNVARSRLFGKSARGAMLCTTETCRTRVRW